VRPVALIMLTVGKVCHISTETTSKEDLTISYRYIGCHAGPSVFEGRNPWKAFVLLPLYLKSQALETGIRIYTKPVLGENSK
jgi:hypothetical protein